MPQSDASNLPLHRQFQSLFLTDPFNDYLPNSPAHKEGVARVTSTAVLLGSYFVSLNLRAI